MVQPIGCVGVTPGMSVATAGVEATPAALGGAMPSMCMQRLEAELGALGLEPLSAALLVALLLRDNEDHPDSAVRLLLAAALAMAMLRGNGHSTQWTSLEFAAHGMPLPAGTPQSAYQTAATPEAPAALDAVA